MCTGAKAPSRNQKGFTIVEVLLFLAVAGFLLLIAFAGLSSRINQVRFTDSMRSLHSYLEYEKSKVNNGVSGLQGQVDCGISGSNFNPSIGVGSPSTNGECMFMGRRFSFSSGSSDVSIDTLIGKTLAGNDLNRELGPAMIAADPKPLNTGEIYTINWGVTLKNTFGGSASNTIGFIHDPRSSTILPFSGSIDISNPTTNLCFEDPSGNTAIIAFGSGSTFILTGRSSFSSGIELRFEDC